MKVMIIYDNESRREDLRADWGFSCLIEHHDTTVLFDTGSSGSLLLENMKSLGIDPVSIDDIFLSHGHFDHIGGLPAVLAENNRVRVYAPSPLRGISPAREVVYIDEPRQLNQYCYTTGLLADIEQSLAIQTEKGLAVIVGCSHPGVENILHAATSFGTPYALIGGLHGFADFEAIKDLQLICPTHCTQHIAEIRSRYPDIYVPGGVGSVIEL